MEERLSLDDFDRRAAAMVVGVPELEKREKMRGFLFVED